MLMEAYYDYRWVMHKTGKYRTLTLICGILPFISAIMISTMSEDSHPVLLWLGIVRLFSLRNSRETQ